MSRVLYVDKEETAVDLACVVLEIGRLCIKLYGQVRREWRLMLRVLCWKLDDCVLGCVCR